MDEDVQIQQRLSRELRPMFEMLMHNLDEMANEKWLTLVHKTKNAVLHQPDQYLSGQANLSELEQSIVDAIFKEFLDRMERSRRKS